VPVAMSYHIRHSMPLSPKDSAPVALPDTEGPWAWLSGPGYVPSRVMRRIYSGQTGGEILHVHNYRDEREDPYRLFVGLILFRLVTPPLGIGVVGPYLVQGGAWFPSRLLLEGTGCI
jgi:hypothetical protein